MSPAQLLRTSPYCIPAGGIPWVSPHEFMQAVMAASNKRFTIEKQSDALEFWSWFINQLHTELTGGKRKRPSIISRCFQVISMPCPNVWWPVITRLPADFPGASKDGPAVAQTPAA